MTHYLYKNHLGGYYVSDEYFSPEDLYCEVCGDSDDFLGNFETNYDLWGLIQSELTLFCPWGESIYSVAPLFLGETVEHWTKFEEIVVLQRISKFLDDAGMMDWKDRSYVEEIPEF